MTLQNIICGGVGGWIVLACLLAPKLGRALKHADPGEDYEPLEDLGEFTEVRRGLPPVPTPRSWVDTVSVDALSDCDPLLHERFDALVTGDWFDGTLHYTGHTHDGGAL